MKTILIAALFLIFAGMAKADSIWNYQGQAVGDPSAGHIDFEQQAFIPTPNPCNCAISGSLTLSDANVPVLWNFSAGAVTLTNLNSSISLDDMAWLGNPNLFAGWMLQIVGQGVFMSSSFSGSNFEATDGVAVDGQTYQYVQGEHGVWTDPPASTPEPMTWVLIIAGVLLILAIRSYDLQINDIEKRVKNIEQRLA